jgi:hypothetical protein
MITIDDQLDIIITAIKIGHSEYDDHRISL